MQKTKKNKKLKKAKLLWLFWLLLILPIVYFAVQSILILTPNMQYEVATIHTMTEKLPVVGQVVLNSQPVYSQSPGHPYYTVPTGQRVAAGANVANIFSSETSVQAMDNIKAINDEISSLHSAQETVAQGGDMEALMENLESGIYGLLNAVESADYSNLNANKNEIALAFNKMQIAAGDATDFSLRIAQLEQLKAQYEAMLQTPVSVTAPAVGFFVPSPMRDAVPMNYEDISALQPLQLKQALAKPSTYYGTDVVGHIVSDFKWSFFISISAQNAEKFVKGDKNLKLFFENAGGLVVPVQVKAVQTDEENSLAMVELYCEYVSPEVLLLRVEEAEVIFEEYKGIRLSKSALRMMDVKNADGSVSTYKGVYIEFGNMVYFKRINIIMEDDFYMLISGEKEKSVNEVSLYDKVVIDAGGVELYDRKIL